MKSMADRIRCSLTGLRAAPPDEKWLQQWISERLTAEGIDHSREVRVGAGYVDFVVARTAMEVKIKGSAISATRQLLEYLEDSRFDEGILVTTRPTSMPSLPGKPIHVIELWSQFI